MSSPIRTEFNARLQKFMEPKGEEKPLVDYIKKRSFDGVRECISAYFDRENDYRGNRQKFLTPFVHLASHALHMGDPTFALRVDILIKRKGTTWERHFTPLPGKSRSAIISKIKQAKGRLTPNQRKFLEWLDGYMNKRASRDGLSKFINTPRFEPLRDCLYAYVEASEAYATRNGADSIRLFELLSRATLHYGIPHFAKFYEAQVSNPGTPWFDRFQTLDQGQQTAIRQDIANRQVIKSDDKTKPGGTHNFGPVSAEPAFPEERQQAAKQSQEVQGYLSAYRKLVTDGERKSTEAFDKILREHPTHLPSFVLAFLADCKTKNDRTQAVFFATLFYAINKGDAYYAFKVDQLIRKAGTDWASHFTSLDEPLMKYRSRLENLIREKLSRARLLDDLKAAYFIKFGKDPTPQALKTFEPEANSEQVELLNLALGSCRQAIDVAEPDRFMPAFKELSDLFRAQKDPMTIFLLARRCRDRGGLKSQFRNLFYLYGVGMLFGALLRTRPLAYKGGLSREEADWLTVGVKTGNRYYDDLVAQLEYATRYRAGADTLANMCAAQGALHIHADRLQLTLTPMIDATALTGAAEQLRDRDPAVFGAIRIPIQSRHTKYLYLGQTWGKFYILWWDGVRQTVYFQVEGLDKVVFEAGTSRLARIHDDDNFYGELLRRTQHLGELIPFFFDIIMLIPSLVQGGVTGLVKDIVFDYLFEQSVRAMGIDPTKLQVLQFGASLLMGGVASRRKRPHTTDTVERDVSAIQNKSLSRNVNAGDSKGKLVDDPATISVGHSGAPAAGSRTATDMPATSQINAGHAPTNKVDQPAIAGDSRTTAATVSTLPAKDPNTSGQSTTQKAPQRKIATVEGGTVTTKTVPPPDLQKARNTDASATDAKLEKGSAPVTPGPSDSLTKSQGTAGQKQKGSKEQKSPKAGEKPETPPGDAASQQRKKDQTPPPPPPPPPDIRNRIVTGNWRKDGQLEINEGGFEISDPQARRGPVRQGGKKDQILVDPSGYEQACNQQIFPAMAERLAPNRTVKVKAPGERGFKSPSSLKTTLLKLQRSIKGAILGRRPEGMMEVIEGTGKNARVVEAHLFESTLQKEFRSATGFEGHKRRQIGGTLWITNEIKRKGYSADTAVNYHIVSTGPPDPKTTVPYLNAIMEQMPNVKITWYVVR